jgi:signal transduction histidine kinase/CheY-like chemotaxis protein
VQAINIITVQITVMIILSSFYLLNWRWGMIYSFLCTITIIVVLITGSRVGGLTDIAPEELASPAYEIIVVLNFITIATSHFLFYRALSCSIVEKSELNIQLQNAVKEANRAVDSKSDFLSSMSHELRTPLNSVIGMTQLLLNSPYTKDQEENLKIINFSALNLHMLINDILDFSKLESEKLNLEAISVDLYKLINEISSGMRFQAREKGLELVVEIDEVIRNYKFITDPTRITQIIHNLLGNAIKFTHSGYASLRLKADKVDDETVDIRFSVTDTGIGINDEQKEMIFDAFTQASKSTTRNYGGTGLGLAIVKSLLVLFETDIHLNSTEGKGSEFFFNILFKKDIEPEIIPHTIGFTKYDLNELKILVVEDNPINILLLKKILLNWSNVPEVAANGKEAIEKVEASIYDVILMDIHMPLIDGYEATRLIRNMPDNTRSTIPIIALTASVSNNLYTKVKDAGMNDFINKPFNAEDLYNKLKSISSNSLKQIVEQ